MTLTHIASECTRASFDSSAAVSSMQMSSRERERGEGGRRDERERGEGGRRERRGREER